jgi:hypothetical protein
MTKKSNENLIIECKQIEDDCKYSAEAHHQIADSAEKISFCIKFIPAVIASISGILILVGVSIVVAWLSVLSGFVLAIASVLDPDRKKNDHIKAAKDYTVLKHDSRALYQAFASEMSPSEFYIATRLLREKYNNTVYNSPKTTDEAFEKARRKIKAGRHSPDFEEKENKR